MKEKMSITLVSAMTPERAIEIVKNIGLSGDNVYYMPPGKKDREEMMGKLKKVIKSVDILPIGCFSVEEMDVFGHGYPLFVDVGDEDDEESPADCFD